MSNLNSPTIVAHRGSSKDAFPNSLESFRLAVKQKADMIELDTHLTQDGHFIVHHDSTIRLKEKVCIISSTKLEAIQELRLPNGEPIPLLKDVLKQLLPSIRFNVEVKCAVKRNQFEGLLKEIGEDSTRIVVSSFRFDVMNELKDSEFGYNLAFLYYFFTPKIKKMADLNYISDFNPKYRYLREKHVKMFHHKKKKVFPWTIDEEKIILKLLKKRVDGIITNDPEETRKIVESVIEKLN